MLKETEAKETIGFVVTLFKLDGILTPTPFPATPMEIAALHCKILQAHPTRY